MKEIRDRIIYGIVSLAILGACSKDDVIDDDYLDEPVCTEAFIPKSFEHEVIAFYPYYRHNTLPVEQIRWEKITRIIYAFARPNVDGTLNTSDLTQINELVETAHENGVEVYLSVGGGGSDSENFPAVAADEEAMARLVLETRQYLFAHCLDGDDIDWEYWTGSALNTVIPAESMAFAEILRMLKEEIDDALQMSMELKKKIKDMKSSLMNKENTDWKDRQRLQNLLEPSLYLENFSVTSRAARMM